MKTQTLLCVGGPRHGERIVVPGGQRSWVVTTTPVWFGESKQLMDPYSPVPFERAVYQVQTLRHDMGETSVTMKVLAYYGRDVQDRPASWSL